MNIKTFFTISGIVGVVYGLFFLLSPILAQSLYEQSTEVNSYTTRLMRFFGGSLVSVGMLALFARDASRSIGRKAILVSMSVFFLLTVIQIGLWLSDGGPSISYIDLAVTALLGIGSIYFLSKEKLPSD